MKTLTAKHASTKLEALIDETMVSHQPVVITSKRTNAVLLSEDDWMAINETLHLVSNSKMRESIQTGMQQKLTDCDQDLDW